MTKRRVQGGGATSERRRRDGVSGKSHLRGFSPPVSATPTNALRALVHSRVHESVARAMRGKCVRHWLMVQVSSFALTTTSTIPRVRTYHTRKPSRFVHALSARPLKKRWAGVDKVNALTGQNLYILFCLFAELGLCLVGVGASTTRMVGELTHMRSMCVGVAETGVEHCSPAKRTLKEKYHK